MRKIERNIFNINAFICRLTTIIRIHLMVSKEEREGEGERERGREREGEREMVSILITSSLPFLLCSFIEQTPQW